MTTTKITGNETIREIMNMKSSAGEILFDAGLGCAMCPHAQVESLRDGCLAHGFDEEEIVCLVNELNNAE
jgi:hybrid cluster-associated redox disulfide protein